MNGDDQMDLFVPGEAYARHTDPETSHEAAQDMKGTQAQRMEKIVLAALAGCLLTTHEIAAKTGIPYATVTPRMRPLCRKGLVIDTGLRRLSPSGKNCAVWKAV